eukprot:SAG22_NODE_242_length_14104_cov_13.581935_12_plen_118_part_00
MGWDGNEPAGEGDGAVRELDEIDVLLAEEEEMRDVGLDVEDELSGYSNCSRSDSSSCSLLGRVQQQSASQSASVSDSDSVNNVYICKSDSENITGMYNQTLQCEFDFEIDIPVIGYL